jgi:ParB-like nuclease domain.
VKKVSLKQEQEKEIIKESKIEPQNADREISIDLLVDYIDSDGVGNDYVFGPVTDDSISNLAKGIEEVGFKTAVEVWELSGEDSGKFMIYSGHRRVAAMKYLKKEKVKCDVYPYPKNEIDRRLQFLRANIHSRGSIKASAEGGDIYIAHQIKYLENILRKQGIKSQAQIDNIVCDEFNDQEKHCMEI